MHAPVYVFFQVLCIILPFFSLFFLFKPLTGALLYATSLFLITQIKTCSYLALGLMFIIMCSEAHWTCISIITAASCKCIKIALSSISSHLILGIYQQLRNFCSFTQIQGSLRESRHPLLQPCFPLHFRGKDVFCLFFQSSQAFKAAFTPLISCYLFKDYFRECCGPSSSLHSLIYLPSCP